MMLFVGMNSVLNRLFSILRSLFTESGSSVALIAKVEALQVHCDFISAIPPSLTYGDGSDHWLNHLNRVLTIGMDAQVGSIIDPATEFGNERLELQKLKTHPVLSHSNIEGLPPSVPLAFQRIQEGSYWNPFIC